MTALLLLATGSKKAWSAFETLLTTSFGLGHESTQDINRSFSPNSYRKIWTRLNLHQAMSRVKKCAQSLAKPMDSSRISSADSDNSTEVSEVFQRGRFNPRILLPLLSRTGLCEVSPFLPPGKAWQRHAAAKARAVLVNSLWEDGGRSGMRVRTLNSPIFSSNTTVRAIRESSRGAVQVLLVNLRIMGARSASNTTSCSKVSSDKMRFTRSSRRRRLFSSDCGSCVGCHPSSKQRV